MRKPESKLQLSIRRRLEATYGGWWRKIWGGPFQVGGLPDLFGLVDGFFFAFEVKLPGREHKTSPLQEKEIAAIQANGGYSGVVSSFEDASNIIDAVFRQYDGPGKNEPIPVSGRRIRVSERKKSLRPVHGAGNR